LKKALLIASLLVPVMYAGCSSPEPPRRFLLADMRIITRLNPEKKGGVETEVLRMKPIDLYKALNRNVKKKKWEKVHENSWKLVVVARDPDVRYDFLLSAVPIYDGDVVIKEMSLNGKRLDSVDIVTNMRFLDEAYFRRK